MPSAARNDTLLTTQLLICYKVLEKTDHVNLDHQVDHADTAAHHELDSTRTTLHSQSESQKAQQQFILSWTWHN